MCSYKDGKTVHRNKDVLCYSDLQDELRKNITNSRSSIVCPHSKSYCLLLEFLALLKICDVKGKDNIVALLSTSAPGFFAPHPHNTLTRSVGPLVLGIEELVS